MNKLDRLSTYYLAGRLYRGKPRTLLFSPTLRCNLKCVHCGIWKNKAEIPTKVDPEKFTQLLADPLFEKISGLWLGGGEPTLLENLFDYYRVGWQTRPLIDALGLITNGYLPNRTLQLVDRLADQAPPAIQTIYVHLSVDGPQPIHDRIRGVEGAFAKMEKVLGECLSRRKKDNRIQPLLNCVLQPENVSHLEELERWAEALGIQVCYNLLSMTDGFYCNTENRDRLAFAPDALERLGRFVADLEKRAPYPLKGHYRNILHILEGGKRDYRCVTMQSTFHLDGDGRTWACPVSSESTVGNALEESPGVIWRSKESRTEILRVRNQLCEQCGLSCSVGDGMDWREWLGG